MRGIKVKRPRVSEIEKYWADKGEFEISPQSEGKNCWACGAERSVERCHIVANALGGSDDVSNFVLMCGACHLESPDTKFTDYFWKWFYDKINTHSFGLSTEFLRECFAVVSRNADKISDANWEDVSKETLAFIKDSFVAHPGRSRNDVRKDLLFLLDEFFSSKKIVKVESLNCCL